MKSKKISQAVILAGGLGSRLKEITKKTPKPLIKINNFAFLDYLIFNISRYGFDKILILTGYKHNLFLKRYHNKTLYFNSRVTCFKEKKPLGTGGALLHAKKKLQSKFLLCNGDTYFDFNINDLEKSFNKNSLIISALTTIKSDTSRYSKVKLKKNYIKTYSDQSQDNSLINTGYCLVNKKILKNVKTKICSLEKDIYPAFIKTKKIQGKVYNKSFNEFIDIGLPKDLSKAEKFLKRVINKKAIFLDRDGVINKNLGYVHKKNNFIWRKGIFKFIKELNDKNYYVFVVTNQSGIGRGYYTEKDLEKLNYWINNTLYKKGAHIDEFFHAPYFKHSLIKKFRKFLHLRKPNTGMIDLAKKKWKINLKNSILIGDQISDKQTAINAKIKYKIINFSDKISL
tara:strand:+ start:705 stop:1898 length:1194 start_codon:yes stop_codon:yes gene_type:complete